MPESISRISLLIPDWPAPTNIIACTTLRGQLQPSDTYSNFNLALHVDDEAEYVMQHRQSLQETLALTTEPCWLEQVHGTECLDLAKLSEEVPTADAAFTRQKTQVCAVLTADCLPLLICDKQGRGVAAIHAGWRGLVDGVIKYSLEKYCHALSIDASECLVWLGPAISQKHFEVGAEVYETFLEQFGPRLRKKDHSEIDQAFVMHSGEQRKYFCDLYTLARLELNALGITAIYGGDQCTYAQADRYYSYRRASHAGHANCGRMASLIWMI